MIQRVGKYVKKDKDQHDHSSSSSRRRRDQDPVFSLTRQLFLDFAFHLAPLNGPPVRAIVLLLHHRYSLSTLSLESLQGCDAELYQLLRHAGFRMSLRFVIDMSSFTFSIMLHQNPYTFATYIGFTNEHSITATYGNAQQICNFCNLICKIYFLQNYFSALPLM